MRPKHPMAKSTKVEEIVIFAYGGRKEGRGRVTGRKEGERERKRKGQK